VTLRSIGVTVVIPTRHEQDSIGKLLHQLSLLEWDRRPFEVVIIDDSDDMLTVAAAKEIAAGTNGFTLRCIRRTGKVRWGGLSGAVVDGFRAARYPIVVVMDGDGQHPAATVLELVAAVEAGNEIAIASRYRRGGSNAGLDGPLRKLVSWGATAVSRLLFPRILRGVTDPMTGFFALNVSYIRRDALARANGYKILLEILAQHVKFNRTEVPLNFQERFGGESKASEGNGSQFVKQLLRLRWATIPQFVSFAVGGGLIALLGMGLLEVLVQSGINPLFANATQLVVTLALNYLFNYKITWRNAPKQGLVRQVLWFGVTRGFTQLLSFGMFAYMTAVGHIHYQIANALALVVCMVINYVTSKQFVFTERNHATAARFLGVCVISAGCAITASVGASLVPLIV
jgi:dolichol-phosphate mannosyltransferase